MVAPFTSEALRFLRGLARNNDRAWFEERRPVYERALREPLLRFVELLNQELAVFAPEYVRPPHKVAMRIYRDIRFSPDKRPYKSHMSAWWTKQGLEKISGGGFYLQIGPKECLLAAGVYAPEREDLLALRQWLAEHHVAYEAVLKPLLRPARRKYLLEPLGANALSRMPKGFPADHPAGEHLRSKNWGVLWRFSAQDALQADFADAVTGAMRETFPLVALLNEPLERRRAGMHEKTRY